MLIIFLYSSVIRHTRQVMDEEIINYQISLNILSKLGITFLDFLNSTQRRQLIIEKLNHKLSAIKEAPLLIDANDDLIIDAANEVLNNEDVYELNILLQCPDDCATFCQKYKVISSNENSPENLPPRSGYRYFPSQHELSYRQIQTHRQNLELNALLITFDQKINKTTADYETLLADIQRKADPKNNTEHMHLISAIILDYMQHLTIETSRPECPVNAHAFQQRQLKDRLVSNNPAEKPNALAEYDKFILVQLKRHTQPRSTPTKTVAKIAITLSHQLYDTVNSHHGTLMAKDYIIRYMNNQYEALRTEYNNDMHRIKEMRSHLQTNAMRLCQDFLTQQRQHDFFETFRAEYNAARQEIERPFKEKIDKIASSVELWKNLGFIPFLPAWQQKSKAEQIESLRCELIQALLQAQMSNLADYVRSQSTQLKPEVPSPKAVDTLFNQFRLGLTPDPLSIKSREYCHECKLIDHKLTQLETAFKAKYSEITSDISAMQNELFKSHSDSEIRATRRKEATNSRAYLIF